jgi:hypothetical protein
MGRARAWPDRRDNGRDCANEGEGPVQLGCDSKPPTRSARLCGPAWLLALALTAGCRGEPPHPSSSAASAARPATGSAARQGEAPAPVGIEMRNVNLRLDDRLVLEVRRLRGRLASVKEDVAPNFDDASSYTLDVDSGEVALSAPSLAWLMNTYVFRGPKAPMKDIEVGFDGGRLTQRGTLRKGVGIPFSITAEVRAAPDGTLQLHVTSRKAAGIPAGGLLDFLGIELDDLVSVRDVYGLRLEDNDLFVDPGRILPPPRVRGRLTGARIEGQRLVQVLGAADAGAGRASPPVEARNYLYFHGGTLRFGRLTMTGTDLQLVDADPRDPFDFYPGKYQRQLVAGYSKATPAGGLTAVLPDYGRVTQDPSLDLTRGFARQGTAGRRSR